MGLRPKSAEAFCLSLLALFSLALSGSWAASDLGPRMGLANNLSLNWSGYAVTGDVGAVSSVFGSWVVPPVSCGTQPAYVAFWAGIDGFSSNTVEQAGVLAQCFGGIAYYSAWYEFYPSPAVTISSLSVKPGDVVSVNVTYSGGAFVIIIIVGSQSFITTGTVNGAARSSAECITERPSIGGSLTKLANFGTAYFGQVYTGITSTCYATISGRTGAFGSFSTVQEITMVNTKGKLLAQPSPLSPDGSSFYVTWYASK